MILILIPEPVLGACKYVVVNDVTKVSHKTCSNCYKSTHQWIKIHAIAVPTIVVPSKVYHQISLVVSSQTRTHKSSLPYFKTITN